MILIAGDSWSAGEWQYANNTHTTVHAGFGQYLMDKGFDVLNLSKGGGSNYETCQRLENFLSFNPTLKIKSIIVCQTEWHRDSIFYSKKDLQQLLPLGYDGIKQQWISMFYRRLSYLSQKWSIPVYLIGGCSDTLWIDQFEHEYPGCKIVCQSWTNLIIGSDSRLDVPVFSQFIINQDFIEFVKTKFKKRSVTLLLDDIDVGNKRRQLIKDNPEYFEPDGIHPNRHAHEILFKQCLENIL
jgi:hypothetical protein